MLFVESFLLNSLLKLNDTLNPFYATLRVTGPILFSSPEYQEQRTFRKEQNLVRAPHLEQGQHLSREEDNVIEQRSLHFGLYQNEKLVATVRLTPAPFELAKYWKKQPDLLQSIEGYFEFSRLCTKLDLPLKGLYARLLLVKAAMHLFNSNQARGIVGICRPQTFRYLQRLGLKPEGAPIWIPERQSFYNLVCASKKDLISYHLTSFLQEFFLGFRVKGHTYERQYFKTKTTV